MRILNGRTLGDSFGKPTSHHKNGTSVVDYIICDQELTQTIENFIVKPPTYLSDHSQIVTWMKTKQHINSTSNITPTPISTTHKLPYQFKWENNSPISFTEALKSVEIQQKLESLINYDTPLTKEGVNTFASRMEDIILHAGKSSLQIKKTKFRNKISNVCNKKWFDKECRLKRHSVRKLANQKHRDPLNNDIRNEYHFALKITKTR
ncbi:Hypothetical predicted protein [Paramuricea clavata]|uniref:Uncharacterized protein n=1 Tax=Paramuricea clavata TaxID=317549 RepID=A0A6S7ISF4_PARCT|nr:Hypothetical predicted protein [Paramuricea clavata]